MQTPTRLVVGPGEADNTEFGEIFERYRVALEMSRAEAAQKLELSNEYLRLVERGRRVFALGTMPKVLTLYGIPYEVEPDGVIFDRYSVTFTSRIREARYKGIETVNRDVRLGQIVRLLTTADDDTLNHIYRRLVRG